MPEARRRRSSGGRRGVGGPRPPRRGAPHRSGDHRGAPALTILFGHRGSRTRFTENTLEAIEEAGRAGAGGIEIDVRPCASGELVVMHDATLERVTRGEDERAVAAMTLDALRGVRLPERIPTLEEVVAYCHHEGLLLNVELKRDVPDRLRATAAAARILGRAPGSILVSSFDPAMLLGVRALAPGLPLALLLEPDHRYLAAAAAPLRCVALHPARTLVGPRLVRSCHARGLRVHVFTVNQLEEARRLLTLGVDGIITDDPARLRPLFD